MHLKTLCAALALLTLSGCDSTPHYRLCTSIDNKKDPLYFYCESTDAKKKAYTVWANEAMDYVHMPIEDYAAILKYAKQKQKELERCEK